MDCEKFIHASFMALHLLSWMWCVMLQNFIYFLIVDDRVMVELSLGALDMKLGY